MNERIREIKKLESPPKVIKNLYNKEISINFKKFIRPEKKFRNLKHLKKQIKLDIKQAKK